MGQAEERSGILWMCREKEEKEEGSSCPPQQGGAVISSLPGSAVPRVALPPARHIPQSLLPSSAITSLASASGASLSPCSRERMGCPHVIHILKGHWDSTGLGVTGLGAHSLAPLWRMLVRDSDVLENPGFIFVSFKSRSKPGASSELFPRAPGFGPVSTCSSQKTRKGNPKESHGYHLPSQCAPGGAAGQILWDKSCSTQLHVVTRLTQTRAQTMHSRTFPSASPGLLSNVLMGRAGLTKSTGAR